MNNFITLRILRYATVAAFICAAAPVSTLAQIAPQGEGEIGIGEGVDAPSGPADSVMASIPGSKSYPGANMTVGYYLDQTRLFMNFRSGTASSNCPSTTVPQWTLTVTRDGAYFYAITSNVWNNVVPSDTGNLCGLTYNWTNAGYEVLTPGTYTFRMSQPAYGADLVASINVPACTAPLPMYSARSDYYTDNFYSISYSQQAIAISLGYTGTGVPFRVSRTNALTLPFKRFFKGAPQIEHFYTHLADEAQFVVSMGYVYENDEGNIFASQLTGTSALYRLSKWVGATMDLQHVYTIYPSEVSSYQAAGWISDGIKGYVCAP